MAPHVSAETQGFASEHHYGAAGKVTSPTLGVNKDSHGVGKPNPGVTVPLVRRDWGVVHHPQPTSTAAAAAVQQQAPSIRVIHIFAPKVIKTDVANFRSTVQRLTGRSCKKPSSGGTPRRGDRAKTNITAASLTPVQASANTCSTDVAGSFSHSMMELQKQQQVEVLQRMVGDACGTGAGGAGVGGPHHHLLRCDSMDSATYSIDSSGNLSGDSCGEIDPQSCSPTNFSFHQLNRQAPYSLNEMVAPFFGAHGDMMHHHHYPSCESTMGGSRAHLLGSPASGIRGSASCTTISLPSSIDQNIHTLGFCEMDISSASLGSPLVDYPENLTPLGTSTGSLYEIFMSTSSSAGPMCRLSVQSIHDFAEC